MSIGRGPRVGQRTALGDSHTTGDAITREDGVFAVVLERVSIGAGDEVVLPYGTISAVRKAVRCVYKLGSRRTVVRSEVPQVER